MENYYDALELAPGASGQEIRRQYRLLLHAWHPDKFPESLRGLVHERMLKINEAYAVLGNPSRRTEYDRRLRSGVRGAETGSQEESERRKRAEEDRKREQQHRALKRQHQIDRLEHRIMALMLDVRRIRAEAPRLATPILTFLAYVLFSDIYVGVDALVRTSIDWPKASAAAIFTCLGIAILVGHKRREKAYGFAMEPRVLSRAQEIQRLLQERELLRQGSQ
jgi:hypothetical protein